MEKIEYFNKKIREYLDKVFKNFEWIIDYHQIKLSNFLRIKEDKKYHKLIGIRICLFLAILINFYLISMPNFKIFFLNFLILHIIFSSLYITIDYWINKKFGYNKILYRKERKKLVNYSKELLLILNNFTLITELEETSYLKIYKDKFNEIDKKIHDYGKIFKPYFETIKQYGLISIFVVLIGFAINLLYENIVNQNIYDISYQIITISIVALVLYYLTYFRGSTKYIFKRLDLFSIENILKMEFKFINKILEEININNINFIYKNLNNDERKSILSKLSKKQKEKILKEILKKK